jgi:hypothetical protein
MDFVVIPTQAPPSIGGPVFQPFSAPVANTGFIIHANLSQASTSKNTVTQTPQDPVNKSNKNNGSTKDAPMIKQNDNAASPTSASMSAAPIFISTQPTQSPSYTIQPITLPSNSTSQYIPSLISGSLQQRHPFAMASQDFSSMPMYGGNWGGYGFGPPFGMGFGMNLVGMPLQTRGTTESPIWLKQLKNGVLTTPGARKSMIPVPVAASAPRESKSILLPDLMKTTLKKPGTASANDIRDYRDIKVKSRSGQGSNSPNVRFEDEPLNRRSKSERSKDERRDTDRDHQRRSRQSRSRCEEDECERCGGMLHLSGFELEDREVDWEDICHCQERDLEGVRSRSRAPSYGRIMRKIEEIEDEDGARFYRQEQEKGDGLLRRKYVLERDGVLFNVNVTEPTGRESRRDFRSEGPVAKITAREFVIDDRDDVVLVTRSKSRMGQQQNPRYHSMDPRLVDGERWRGRISGEDEVAFRRMSPESEVTWSSSRVHPDYSHRLATDHRFSDHGRPGRREFDRHYNYRHHDVDRPDGYRYGEACARSDDGGLFNGVDMNAKSKTERISEWDSELLSRSPAPYHRYPPPREPYYREPDERPHENHWYQRHYPTEPEPSYRDMYKEFRHRDADGPISPHTHQQIRNEPPTETTEQDHLDYMHHNNATSYAVPDDKPHNQSYVQYPYPSRPFNESPNLHSYETQKGHGKPQDRQIDEIGEHQYKKTDPYQHAANTSINVRRFYFEMV